MRRLILLLLVLGVIGGAALWFVALPQWVTIEPVGFYQPNLDNGRTIFLAGGCASCHATPKQDDPLRLGGGLALKSPFGTFYPPNISPHPRDGIGAFTELEFINAILKGVSPEGHHYYPAFPYTSYQRLVLGDVRDLFGYLKTLAPVEGRAPAHALNFPFNIREGVGLWKLLYFDGEEFRLDPTKSRQWNRGAYLVEGAGHCAECHSPRNWLGAIVASKRFAGGPNPAGKGEIPDITQDKDGLADWSEEDIYKALTDGVTPSGDRLGGSMAEIVRNISQLSDEDRRAMAVYVKSLPPVAGAK
ncbi:MAG TPA: cytochrome c [Xanthobacteraceae bacterium]|nr:cytochrome c [Xanthobacteraceae bacterium]